MIKLPAKARLWEYVAALQLAQSIGCKLICSQDDLGNQRDQANQVNQENQSYLVSQRDEENQKALAIDQAYRKVEDSEIFYGELLAECSGLGKVELQRLKLPVVDSDTGSIIVCPSGCVNGLNLHGSIWKLVAKMLRTYWPRVCLLAEDRMDDCVFTEAEILNYLTLEEKIQALASAKLIVGVPNEWLWLATAWPNKKMIVLYPDEIPARRWFLYNSTESWCRLIYPKHQLQAPMLLAALRKLIKVL